MPLLTQYVSFFVSPFGEKSVCDELNGFLKSNRIVNVEKRLIDGERGTGWLFLVEYGGEHKSQPNASSSPRVDYREILNAQEYALFDKLRQIRKDLAEKQGIPVYAVFTNDHLASMVKTRPTTLKDIAALPGVGEARVKQYGAVFIKALGASTPAESAGAEVSAAEKTNPESADRNNGPELPL
jgi:superfamily II DNA helicase RecQ